LVEVEGFLERGEVACYLRRAGEDDTGPEAKFRFGGGNGVGG